MGQRLLRGLLGPWDLSLLLASPVAALPSGSSLLHILQGHPSPPFSSPDEELYYCGAEELFCLYFSSDETEVTSPTSDTPKQLSLCVPRPTGCGDSIGAPCCPGVQGCLIGILLAAWR